jgi:GTP cyclohydrolase I
LTHAIAGYLDDELDPAGLIVMMEAEHMCMTIRGVQAPGTRTTTTQLRGLFLDPPQGRDPKAEFLTYVGR